MVITLCLSLPSPTRCGHSPPPQAFPLPSRLCGDIPTLRPLPWKSTQGPLPNTPSPSCSLQSRVLSLKTDAGTFPVLSPLPSPPDMLSPGPQLQTQGPPGTALACLEFTSLGLNHLLGHPQHWEGEAGTEGLLGGTWGRQMFPEARELGGDPAGRWSLESPCRPGSRDPRPREGEAGDTLGAPVARTPSSRWEGPGFWDLWGPWQFQPPPPRRGTQPSKLQSCQACAASRGFRPSM